MLGFLILYNEPNSITPPTKNKTSILQIGFVFIILLWLMNSIGAYWIADYKYAQADIALKNNNVETSVALLQEALSLRNEHVYEDKLSYVLAQYAYMLATQRDKDKAAQATDMAEKLNDKSLKASSQNVLYWKTRVKNQFIFYQMSLDKKYLHTGLSALEEARKLAPTDPKVPYFSATYNSLLYDDEKVKQQKKFYETKSLEAIDKTIALKPDYGDAYYLKFQLLKKYGNKADAKKLLEWYIPRYTPGNQEMIKELNQL